MSADDRDPVALANPLRGNPLRTRADVEEAMRAVYEPLVPYVSPGGARLRLSSGGSSFAPAVVDLEAFARPLWGLAPLAAGGGRFDHWPAIRRGLASGTDADGPEYWGATGNKDQRMVEMAAIGAGLLLAPHELWDPLAPDVQRRLAAWLGEIDRRQLISNNWQFFRVLVDLGLERVGVGYAERAHRESLDDIDACALDGGWYGDGRADRSPEPRVDWYGPFAFHVYGLLYAASGLGDADHAERFRRRAAAFAQDHRHWFAPDGSALAFGRSMTYRFVEAAFWGMLAAADVEALPWGQVKGLYLRNLRHWAAQPISDRDGVLSIGHGYDNRLIAESYMSPGSPYWSCKAFLALLAPAEHPFWTTAEEPLDRTIGSFVQPVPGMVLSGDGDQALAVSARQQAPGFVDHGAAKYARFAYSSSFGFSVDDDRDAGAAGGAGSGGRNPTSDSTLSLTDADGVRRVRRASSDFEIEGELLATRWEPWPDVSIETVLWGRAPWHARAHHIRTGRALVAHEWGFALGYELPPGARSGLPRGDTGHDIGREPGSVVVTSVHGRAGLLDVNGTRAGEVRSALINLNLRHPATAVPVLVSELPPGEHLLMCLGFGSGPAGIDAWDHPPGEPAGMLAFIRRRAGLDEGPPDVPGRASTRPTGRPSRPGPLDSDASFDSLRPLASRLRRWISRG